MSKFKAGDKLKYIGTISTYLKDVILTVESVSIIGNDVEIRLKGYAGYWYEDRFELVSKVSEIDWTKPLETKSGEPFELLTERHRNFHYPMLGYVGTGPSLTSYTNEGKFLVGSDCDKDLQNVKSKPLSTVKYFNLFKNGLNISFEHPTRKSADNAHNASARIGCKRVVFTEGEFDE